MQIKLSIITLVFSGFLFSQTNVVTSEYGNLTIEWEKSLEEWMEQKENQVCSTAPSLPEPTPQFCRGARIQVFYSKNRSEAEEKLKEIKSLFPSEFSNLEYNSPDYKIKLGHFDSRESAQTMLNRARRAFPSSLIVEETIRCSLID